MPLADSRICNACERENPIGNRRCLKCGTELNDENSRLKEFVEQKSPEEQREELLANYAGLAVLALKGLELLACGAIVLALLIWLIDRGLFWSFLQLHHEVSTGISFAVAYLVGAQIVRYYWLKQTTVSGRELGE